MESIRIRLGTQGIPVSVSLNIDRRQAPFIPIEPGTHLYASRNVTPEEYHGLCLALDYLQGCPRSLFSFNIECHAIWWLLEFGVTEEDRLIRDLLQELLSRSPTRSGLRVLQSKIRDPYYVHFIGSLLERSYLPCCWS